VLRYVRPNGGGPFHDWGVALGGEGRFTTDGTGRQRGNGYFLAAEFQLRSFDSFGVNLNASADFDDVRELQRSGVALRRPGDWNAEFWFATDKGRALWVMVYAATGGVLAGGPLPATPYGWVGGELAVRPHPRLETGLAFSWENSAWPARYLSDDGAGTFTLAALRAPSASVTLRQLVVLTTRLTVQGYAQLFTDYGRHGTTYTARGERGGVIGYSSLTPAGATSGSSDFQDTALNLSLLLRWEYRLGSTLYLVYTHEALGPPDRALSLWPTGLARGPARDTALCKWTWYWSS
jgi:hypothetical protein